MRGILMLAGLSAGLAGGAAVAQPMPGMVVAGAPSANGCEHVAIVSGNADHMRVAPMMACRHQDRRPAADVAVPYHRGEVPRDYDLVCSSSPGELGDYVWDVDKDRYVHAGREEFSPGEQGRTLMLQVSESRAKVWLPARLGGGGWTWLEGARVDPGAVRARLAGGAALAVSPTRLSVTISKPKKLLYSGRCTMITAVGSRDW